MNKFFTSRVILLAAALTAVLTPVVLGFSGSTTTVTSSQSVDITGLVIPAPCATVTASGSLHIVSHVTDLGNGSTRVVTIRHPQGVTGISTTGDEYVAGGSYAEVNVVSTGSAQVFSIASPFVFTGKKKAPNIKVTQIIHSTVNANGTVTSTVDHENITCQ